MSTIQVISFASLLFICMILKRKISCICFAYFNYERMVLCVHTVGPPLSKHLRAGSITKVLR